MKPSWNELESAKIAQSFVNIVAKEGDKTKKKSSSILKRKFTLYEEMIEERRQFCMNQCQNNKVINMLRPKCHNRRYLDVLFLNQIPKKLMPIFCYEQRIKGLIRSFREEKPLLHDSYILIDDFWKIVRDDKAKSKVTASDLLKRSIGAVIPSTNPEKIDLHYLKNQLFILWPKLDLCLINAQETEIQSLDMLKLVVRTLADAHKLEVNISIDENLIELEFINLDLSKIENLEQILSEYKEFTGFSEDTIWAEITLPSAMDESISTVKIEDVKNIFLTIAKCESSKQ